MKERKRRAKRVKFICHFCGKQGTVRKDSVVEQSFTGRRFCSVDHFNAHARSKGF